MFSIDSRTHFGARFHCIQTGDIELANCLYESALDAGLEPEITELECAFLIQFVTGCDCERDALLGDAKRAARV